MDLERTELVVRVAKRDQQERVVVTRELLDHLVGFLAERGEGPLFTGPGGREAGEAPSPAADPGLGAHGGGGMRGSAHSLRHSFALRLYARTRDLLVVQRALRHHSVASTLVYVRATDADVRRVLEA
ncbi:MAG: site-specific integrase [Planctomycetes bacterium]|nr:site-specific integrase [Planctomycetota bacterium]